MPIFNAEKHLKTSLNSIVNQSIGLENLQVIMVNDCSTDNSGQIIDEYSNKYRGFEAIHLEKNIGGAYGPRNIGLKVAAADYLMFLDSDDSYELNACEILYDKISSKDIDIVFGRYKRIYSFEEVKKSYSPFKDNINEYDDDIVGNPDLSKLISAIWKKIFSNFIYGKKIKKDNSDEIFIENISQDPNFLKILPSIWTKIFKRELIEKNNIEFPPFISGEDLNFVIEAYLNASGILLLNNTFINNYYMRENEEDQSITKNITFKLIFDSLKAYSNCSKLCIQSQFKYNDIILNPFLLHWINLFSNFNGDLKENYQILKEAHQMRKFYKNNVKSRIIIFLVVLLIKISIFRLKISNIFSHS